MGRKVKYMYKWRTLPGTCNRLTLSCTHNLFLCLIFSYIYMYINKILISMEGLFVLNMHFTRELNLSHCEFESCLWQGVLNTTLCDKVCQQPATVRCFFSWHSTNKTDFHDISEILLKMALNTIKQNQTIFYILRYSSFECLMCIRSI